VIVLANASPLVILAKLGCFDLLQRLFPRLYFRRPPSLIERVIDREAASPATLCATPGYCKLVPRMAGNRTLLSGITS